MKVCFLLRSHPSTFLGGAELQADKIATYLSKKGHKIYYIFDSNNKDNVGNNNYKIFTLNNYGEINSFLNFRSLLNLLDEIKPDLVYQRCRNSYTGIASIYCNKNKVPLVFSVANNADCINENITFSPFALSRLLNKYLGIYGLKNSSKIIAQSKFQAQLIKDNFHKDSIVIPNSHNFPNNKKKEKIGIVSWVANIKPSKRLELFLDLADSLKSLKIFFVVAGRLGNDNYCKTIYMRMKAMNNVKYLGYLALEDCNLLLSKSEVFVNTSKKDSEGFPNTYIQSLMQNTPVVSLSFDPDDFLKNNGIGLESKNFDKLVSDVKNLVLNNIERKKMGSLGYSYSMENFRSDNVLPNYEILINQLVKEKQ